MEESSLYNHGINHELTNFCTLNHNIIKQVQKFKIICMDTNSMNLISTLWESEKWKRASTEWSDVGVGEWECESRVVGGTPVSLLVSQDFIISSPLLRVLSLWLASGHWRVCCPDCLQSRAWLSDFTFQHIPATVDSRKVHGCDLGMMAPGFEDDPILHCDSF